jgi:thymidine kinase
MLNEGYHLRLITGPMFSKKTTRLIEAVGLYEVADFKIQLFKPNIDTRYDKKCASSHHGLKKEAISVSVDVNELEERIDEDTQVLAIEEGQFFSRRIVDVCDRFAHQRGGVVIVAHLDRDYLGKPFAFYDGGDVRDFFAVADSIDYRNAVCKFRENGDVCRRDAAWSQKFKLPGEQGADELVKVGFKEYEPRCGEHFKKYVIERE